MKKPNEKNRIFQKHENPDHFPVTAGCPFPKGTLPKADGSCPHPMDCRDSRNPFIPPVRETVQKMLHFFICPETDNRSDDGSFGKTTIFSSGN